MGATGGDGGTGLEVEVESGVENDEEGEKEKKRDKEKGGVKPMEVVGQVDGVIGAEEDGAGEGGAEQVEMDEEEAGVQKEKKKRKKSGESDGGEAKASRVEERSEGARQVGENGGEEKLVFFYIKQKVKKM
ncbi:hypothetical protein EYF80_064224 [Liparis tanakae]|uniref:Uncharacterized protein n=1 Tax=Liparis tanakae TaxID=230148 RepID=A0A4Z2EA67_9TELE|nr:hypothetical protein EYF80_064224 [Liparis tanakae]